MTWDFKGHMFAALQSDYREQGQRQGRDEGGTLAAVQAGDGSGDRCSVIWYLSRLGCLLMGIIWAIGMDPDLP